MIMVVNPASLKYLLLNNDKLVKSPALSFLSVAKNLTTNVILIISEILHFIQNDIKLLFTSSLALMKISHHHSGGIEMTTLLG